MVDDTEMIEKIHAELRALRFCNMWRLIIAGFIFGFLVGMLAGCGSRAVVSTPIEPVPVWLCAGQSNMEDGRTAWAFSEAMRAAGKPVSIINASRGGTTIDGWLPGGREWGERITPYIGQQITGVIWWQGESDALNGSYPAYEANLTAFIGALRSEFGQIPVIIVRLQRYDASLTAEQAGTPGAVFTEPDYWRAVQDAQEAVAAKLAKTYIVDISGITHGEVHPTYAYGEIGRRIAQIAINTSRQR